MSETTEDVAQNAENAACSLAELVSDLQYGGTEHQVPANRIYALFTRCAEQMKTALTLLRTSVESLQDQGLLMSDYRGEPLEDVLQRYTEFSALAERLAGELGEADSVIERQAHNEASSEQEPTADRFIAKLVADLRHQGIDYPLEANRILSFLTRCAGEMRTALAVLKALVEDREGHEVQRYAAPLLSAEQLAGVLGKAYSAAGYLAYREPTERGRA